jgi:hypothetical protein
MVQVDFLRGSGSGHKRLRDQVTRSTSLPSGQALPNKVCSYINNKLHALFLDTSLNGDAIVATTLLQISLFAALKLHCYVASLPEKVSGRAVVAATDAAVAYITDAAPRSATTSAVSRSLGSSFGLSRCVQRLWQFGGFFMSFWIVNRKLGGGASSQFFCTPRDCSCHEHAKKGLKASGCCGKRCGCGMHH